MPDNTQKNTPHDSSFNEKRRADLESALEDTVTDFQSATPNGHMVTRNAAESPKQTHFRELAGSFRLRRTTANPAGKTAGAPAFRYGEATLLGSGTTADVYSIRDCFLNREVAVKILRETGIAAAQNAFLREAEVAAGLEHPNIMPVYDMDVEEDGETYFTMRRIHGHALSDLIKRNDDDQAGEHITGIERIVDIFIKVCDAVAYAHDKGVIHRDIKPSNIMVGRFGEVLLVDWGAASRIDTTGNVCLGTASGSPAYMSPEQARGDSIGIQSDIYSIGAAMFHALFKRHPTTARSLDEFWEKKQRGVPDEPSEQEKRGIPPPVVAIVMRALSPLPENRYASASDLAVDLKNYQAGCAVAAYRDTLRALVRRWYRRNRPGFWYSMAIASVVMIFAIALYKLKLREIAIWGVPVCVEQFDDDVWKERWIVREGLWKRVNGRLISANEYGNRLFLRERLYGGIALEFDARFSPETRPGDMSVLWTDTIRIMTDRDSVDSAGATYQLQAGAYDNSFSQISFNNVRPLSYNAFTYKPGRTYRVRAEIEEERLTLSVDGKVICRAEDPFLFNSGHIGLYAIHAGKIFDNVRIYVRKPPKMIPSVAVGDELFRREQLDLAAQAYAGVAAAHPGTRLADNARYRQGHVLFRMNRKEEAWETWRSLKGTRYDSRVTVHELERLLELKRYDSLETGLRNAFLSARDAGTRNELMGVWANTLSALNIIHDGHNTARFIRLQEESFAVLPMYHYPFARALNMLGRHEQVLAECLSARWECGGALLELGRYQEVIDRYSEQDFHVIFSLFYLDRAQDVLERFRNVPGIASWALRQMGRFDEAIALYPEDEDNVAISLSFMGRYEEALQACGQYRQNCAGTLLHLGRFDDLLEHYPDTRKQCAMALIKQNRCDRVIEDYPDQQVMWTWCKLMQGGGLDDIGAQTRRDRNLLTIYVLLRSYIAGTAALPALDSLCSYPEGYFHRETIFAYYILCPFLHFLDGSFPDLRQAFADILHNRRYSINQELWHAAAYITGDITVEQFHAQPSKVAIKARGALYGAMAREYAGDRAEALRLYNKFNALPPHETIGKNPISGLFVSWRIDVLSGEPAARAPDR